MSRRLHRRCDCPLVLLSEYKRRKYLHIRRCATINEHKYPKTDAENCQIHSTTHVICAGFGSQIYAYNISDGNKTHSRAIVFEDGTRVHGIHGTAGPWGPLLAVHGGRNAKVRMQGESSFELMTHDQNNHLLCSAAQVFLFRSSGEPAFENLGQLGPFSQWTLDIHVNQISSAHVICVVGLSNNSVQVFRITADGNHNDAKVRQH